MILNNEQSRIDTPAPERPVITDIDLWRRIQQLLGPNDGLHIDDATVEQFTEQLPAMMETLHQQAVADPANQPDKIIARITSQYRNLNPWASRPVTTLDQAAAYSLTLKRFRSAGLAPYDEMALLKATAIAGFSRDTPKGLAMGVKAIRMLHHEASNTGPPPNVTASYNNHASLATRFYRTVYAIHALGEVYARDGATPVTSIDKALLQWDEIGSLVADTIASDEVLLDSEIYRDGERRVGFRRLMHSEVEARLQGLRIIGSDLQDTFGSNISVSYFESVVFNGDDKVITPEDDQINKDEDETEPEESSYFSPDYVIAEITEPQHDGATLKHVVAESLSYGNACYALRADTLATLSETLGEPLEWRKVLSYRKKTAQQLGAKNFRHSGNSLITDRVLNYFDKPLGETLDLVAKKWFTSEKAIYDQNLQPTKYNRLPVTLIEERVTPRVKEIHAQMMTWLIGASPRRLTIIPRIGETVVEDGNAIEQHPEPEAAPVEEATVAVGGIVQELQKRNEELAVENERLRLTNLQLTERLDAVKRLLEK